MENEKDKPTLNKIEEFLQEIIQRLEPIRSDPIGRGRPRVLPAMCLWAGVIVCILRGWNDVDFIQLAVERGREAGFIRPSRRIRIKTPPVELSAYSPHRLTWSPSVRLAMPIAAPTVMHLLELVGTDEGLRPPLWNKRPDWVILTM